MNHSNVFPVVDPVTSTPSTRRILEAPTCSIWYWWRTFWCRTYINVTSSQFEMLVTDLRYLCNPRRPTFQKFFFQLILPTTPGIGFISIISLFLIVYFRQWTCFEQNYWCSSWNIMIKNIKKVFCKTPSVQIRSSNVVYKTNLVFETLQRCINEIQRDWFEPFWYWMSALYGELSGILKTW